MSSVFRDLRDGLRVFTSSPGVAAAAVLTLALGISASTAIFSVVHATFFAPLPYRDADALVMVWSKQSGQRIPVSPHDFAEWRRRATSFTALEAWGGRGVNIAGRDRPEHVTAGLATPGFLAMLGYGHPLALGRTFSESEGIPGNDRVAVLSNRLWRDRFGADPEIIGRPIRLDGQPHVVVGVFGAGPADRQQNALWLPLAFTAEQLMVENHWLNVMGRLRPGVTIQQANQDVNALQLALQRERTGVRPGWSNSVEPFRNNFLPRSTTDGLWLLLAAVGLLQVIACVNVANLLLARGVSRQRELVVRSAMGASPATIVRQLLAESLVIAAAGCALGIAGAAALIRIVVALMPPFTLPSETVIALNVPVLGAAVLASLAAGGVAGLVPAWQALRVNAADAMKQGGRAVTSDRRRLARSLVVVELALALVLLTTGAAAVRALVATTRADWNLLPEDVLTMGLPVAAGRLETAAEMEQFYRALLDGTRRLPGVVSATVSSGMPVWGTGFGDAFEIVGRPHLPGTEPPGAGINSMTPGYFRTFGITVLQGRDFTERDRAGAPHVGIVNEALVRRHLAGLEPLSVRLRVVPYVPDVTPPPVEVQIVGVVADVPNTESRWVTEPELYVPFWQAPWQSAWLSIRTRGNHAALVPELTRIVGALDPELPIHGVRTMEQLLADTRAADQFHSLLFASFGVAATLLAAIGIYGVLAFTVAWRTQEIGVRMAVGASPARVLVQVLREGMMVAVLGAALGGGAAWLAVRAMAGLVHGVEATGIGLLAVTVVALLGVALAACLVPARRAASVEPVVALRSD